METLELTLVRLVLLLAGEHIARSEDTSVSTVLPGV